MPFDPLELLLDMELEIIDNMTRLLDKGAVESAAWQMEKLADLGALRLVNTATVEKYLNEIAEGLPEYYEKLGESALEKSGVLGLSDVPSSGFSATLAATYKLWETQTLNTLKTLGMTLIDESQTTYIQIVYKSAAKMLSGATTLRQAIAETSSEWRKQIIAEEAAGVLKDGIPAFKDKAGRRWSVEGYSQVVLRSNEGAMTRAVQNAAFDEFDVDLVEITSHMGARPLCAPYQGRVFSRSGKSSKYPPLSSTTIGQPAGLFGCNCHHDPIRFDPAVGQTYPHYNEAENAKAYEASQKQRYYERQIRARKKDLSLAKLSGDEKVIARAKNNMSNAQGRMREFIKDSGNTRHYDREQVY